MKIALKEKCCYNVLFKKKETSVKADLGKKIQMLPFCFNAILSVKGQLKYILLYTLVNQSTKIMNNFKENVKEKVNTKE